MARVKKSRSKLCPIPPQLSQSWFVLSAIAGLQHYVHILNFEDVHPPVDKELHQVNQVRLERISCSPR